MQNSSESEVQGPTSAPKGLETEQSDYKHSANPADPWWVGIVKSAVTGPAGQWKRLFLRTLIASTAILLVLMATLFVLIQFFGLKVKAGKVYLADNTEPTLRGSATSDTVNGRTHLPSAFANFGSVWPNANTGTDWQIFNDNKFLGRSSVWYETVPNPDVVGDHLLRTHFSLNRGTRSMASDAYAGIFIDLAPPLGSADLSQYSLLRFRVRRVIDPDAAQLRFYVNLANPKIRDYAYHELEFSDSLHKDGSFAVVNIPFVSLRQPEWATDRTESFDARDVYRMTFFVKGNRGTGYLDLDDIEFIDIQKH